jgi:hypothetical protein
MKNNHPHQAWRARWTVDLSAKTATHRDGFVFLFRSVDAEHGGGLEAKCIQYPEPLTEEHKKQAARIAREAGDIYQEVRNRPDVHPALAALRAVAKDYPDAWRLADTLRYGTGRRDWPDWCYLPIAGWYAIAAPDMDLAPQAAGDVSRLAALGAWRVTQGIYRFDPDLLSALMDTPVTGDIPCAALYRLPEWCIYIETPPEVGLLGFWAHLEYDVKTGVHELRFLFDHGTGLAPFSLHIGPWSLETGIQKAHQLMAQNLKKLGKSLDLLDKLPSPAELAISVAKVLPPVLYLCAENAEIGDGIVRPTLPNPIRSKKSKTLRMFPPDKPKTWDVGIRIGSVIRAGQVKQGGDSDGQTGAHVRPHIRKAHWHGFRSGRRLNPDGSPIPAEARPFTLRWLPPIAVNVENTDELPAVIHPVKESQ